jgi:hypothetical protein
MYISANLALFVLNLLLFVFFQIGRAVLPDDKKPSIGFVAAISSPIAINMVYFLWKMVF